MRRGVLAWVGAAGILCLAPTAHGDAAEPKYWPAEKLEARPQIKTHVMPEYPKDLPAGVRGRVVLELFVAPDGTLDRVRVASAEPRGRFEQAALKAFSAAGFTPGIRKGKAVPSLVRIEVTFGN
ncbi:MAG TPA: energy transducer TonB [Burkholderiales bacterium]|nr:energy transducer TonB [Burkholderiales bacterium]